MNKQEIIAFLQEDSQKDWLFKEADRVRRERVGDAIHLRALIEFSNICKRHCKYCGIRAGNTATERYRLEKEDIIVLAKKAVDLGYRTKQVFRWIRIVRTEMQISQMSKTERNRLGLPPKREQAYQKDKYECSFIHLFQF
jgi:biotin synthase-like enzyme